MKKIIFAVIVISKVIFGQTIQVEDAIDFALKNNPQIKRYEAKLNQKEFQNLEALGNFLPQINLNASYTHLNDAIAIDLDPIRQAMIQIRAKHQVEFANIYIFASGKSTTERSTAKCTVQSIHQPIKFFDSNF
ncbi:TolC family protein [Ignavibacterium sp.]|uniref:TolC family protein n=1 Tax=Ignavibacterium sp. TaxID=2651167 RepID=UPI00307F922B